MYIYIYIYKYKYINYISLPILFFSLLIIETILTILIEQLIKVQANYSG